MNTLHLSARSGLLAVAFCLVALPAIRAEAPAGQQAKPEKSLSRAQKIFDKDGDGKLSEEEAAAYRESHRAEQQARLKKYDTDNDGKLSEEEKAALKAEAKKKKSEKKKEE